MENFVCVVEIIMSITDGNEYKSDIPTVCNTWADRNKAVRDFDEFWKGHKMIKDRGTRLRTVLDDAGCVVAVLQLISVETPDDDE